MSVIVDAETGATRFDLRTHIIDPKTGKLLKYQPYRKHINKGGNPSEWYERDGIRYLESGECLDKALLASKQAKAKEAKASVNPEAPKGDAVDL